MAKKFNGSTLSLNSALIGGIKSMNDDDTGAEIDVTGADSDEAEYELGKKHKTISMTTVGTTTVELGDTGPLVATWTDGQTRNLGNAIVTRRSKAGSEDGVPLFSFTFRKAPAA